MDLCPLQAALASLEQSVSGEFEQGRLVLNRSHQYLSPGIIAGWDIRPTLNRLVGVRKYPLVPFPETGYARESTINMQQVELNFPDDPLPEPD